MSNSDSFNELLQQASATKLRQENDRANLNDIKKKMVNDYQVPSKRVANRIINAYHKGTFEQEQSEDESFHDFMERVKHNY